MQQDKEGLTPSKLTSQQVIFRIEKIASKSDQCFLKVIKTIESMVEKIQECEKKLENGEQPSEVLNKLHNTMTETRPLKTVRDQFNSYYKRLSAFGRELTIQQQEKIVIPEGLVSEQEISLIEEALAEHFLRQGKWNSAVALHDINQNSDIFRECSTLSEKILNNDYEDPIKWVESEKLYETYDNLLEYQLKKLNLLKMIKSEEHEKAIEYYKNFMTKFEQKKQGEIYKFIAYILFSAKQFWKNDQTIPQRYVEFQRVNLQQIANMFTTTYLNHYNISIFDSIEICHRIGSKHKRQFVKNYNFISQEEKSKPCLPFSLPIDSHHRYHSQFLCPISKDLLASKEGTVLFKCGHVISEAAYNRMAENRMRRKMKCPVCQEQQKSDEVMQVQF